MIKRLFPKKAMNINDLPPHLIIEILQRVNPFLLNQTSLTCKLWRQLIDSYCTNILEIPCKKLDSERVNFLLSTNKTFKKIKIIADSVDPTNTVYESLDSLYKILDKHGSCVVQLCLFGRFELDIDAVAKMLKHLPNLEYLRIHSTKLFSDDSLDDVCSSDFVDLPKLKTLTLNYNNESCFRIISRLSSLSNLEVIEIRPNSRHSMTAQSLQLIRHFLQSQKCLSKLKIKCEKFDTEIFDDEMVFKLKTLSMMTENIYTSEKFVKFMKMQAETVTDLTLTSSPDFWPIFKLIFTDFKYLRNLRLRHVAQTTESKEFFAHLPANTSITYLRLDGCRTPVDELIRLVPNVIELNLCGRYDRITIQFIADNLKQLAKLSVSDLLACPIGVGVVFPNLTSLSFDFYDGNMDWDRFTIEHNQIIELKIKFMNSRGQDLMEFNPFLETTFKNLKKLTFLQFEDYNLFPDKDTFAIIRKNCSSSKIIDLTSYYLDRIKDKKVFNIPGLIFSNYWTDPRVEWWH